MLKGISVRLEIYRSDNALPPLTTKEKVGKYILT